MIVLDLEDRDRVLRNRKARLYVRFLKSIMRDGLSGAPRKTIVFVEFPEVLNMQPPAYTQNGIRT